MYATQEVLTPSHVMTLPDKYGSGASQESYGFLQAPFQWKSGLLMIQLNGSLMWMFSTR